MEDINYQFYFNAYSKYGVSAKGVHWQSKEKQYTRFKILTSYMEDINNSTIIDLGCGFGEYLNFLKQYNLKFQKYIGIDCEDFMIKEAKKRFPSERFIKANFLEDKIETADYIICSGSLNILKKDEFLEGIKKSFSLANKALVFNFLTKNSIHNMSKKEIINFSKQLSNKIEVSSKYMQNDATIYLKK